MAFLSRDAAEAHIFDFEELVHSVFERFDDAPNAGHVSPVEVRSQPEFRVIREGNRLRIRLETEEGRDWTEGFFARDGHLRRDTGENGRLKKAAAERMAMPADEYFCTLGLRVANMAFDFQHRRV